MSKFHCRCSDCIEEEEFYIALDRLRLAVRELFIAICEATGIDKLVRWIDALLEGSE